MILSRFILSDFLNDRLDIDTRVSLEEVLTQARSIYGAENVDNTLNYVIGTRDPMHEGEEAHILAIFGFIARCMQTNDDMLIERGIRTAPRYQAMREELTQLVIVYGRILF